MQTFHFLILVYCCAILTTFNARIMFWSEMGGDARIECAGMDGSDRRVLIKDDLRWPVGLAVDSLGQRIYWTDEKLKCIGSATFDGGDIKVLHSPFMHLVGL